MEKMLTVDFRIAQITHGRANSPDAPYWFSAPVKEQPLRAYVGEPAFNHLPDLAL
jgi:hypothetical protein